jgi:hypothetical protein
MANHSRLSVLRDTQQAGFRAGVLSALRGTSYGAAPVRIHKSVGSPATDRKARYGDIEHFRHDVRRAERIVLDQ